MNSRRAVIALIAGVIGVVFAILSMHDWSGPPKPTVRPAARQVDNTGNAVEVLRNATNVAACRDALRTLTPVLEKQPDLRLSDAQRAWLTKAGFNADELAELDAKTYRPLDAYHVDTSMLFRDASRILAGGLDPLEQAKVTFDWVGRRVLLHQHAQEGIPAAFVLRAGYGGPGDRAAVFLAVLHQLRIPGCVLALPRATEPNLVAVLVQKEAYLFDPRTGRPLPTADGKETATWRQLRAQPELGKFVDLTPEQIDKLEARLMTPVESLTPRMEYLERLLQGDEANVGGERIGLWVDIIEIERGCGEAGLPPLGLWNPGPELGPLHALRRFLPADEGGRDTTGRQARFALDLVPSGPVIAQYRKLRLLGDGGTPSPVERMKIEQLIKITEMLFDSYYAQPQEMLVRGKTEEMPRRLDRIRTMLEDADQAEAGDDFAQTAAAWRKRADEAYLSMVRNDASANEKIARLWGEDSLDWLLRPGREIGVRTKEPQILTRLILKAVREPMSEQADFLFAGLSEDRAERAEALAQHQRQLGKDTKTLDRNATDAWKNARSGWTRYVDRGNLGPTTLPAQLDAVRQMRNVPEPALASLENLQLELHRYASARLQLAQAQSRLGVDVGPELDALIAELEPISRTDGPLAKEGEAFRYIELPPAVRESFNRRLDLLRRDFGTDGYFAWTIREVRAVRGK
jgi:hypothetical protein